MTTSENVQKKKMGTRRILFILSFIIVPTINFLVFYVYVNLSSFVMAFYKTVDGNIVWTFENFSKVFKELSNTSSDIYLAMINTFKTFLINLCMYPVSIIISYFLYKKIRLHNLFRMLFFLPQIVSGIVYAYFYTTFVSSAGPIPALLQRLYNLDYMPSVFTDSRFANAFVWIHMIWLAFPGNLIVWGGTFSRIPDSVLEYAKLDGVGWIRELVQIILPMVWPTFSLFLILQLGGIFSASGDVFTLTFGEFGTNTLSNWFYLQVYGVSLRPGSNTFNYMSAFGLLITVVACAISFLSRNVLAKLVPDVEF